VLKLSFSWLCIVGFSSHCPRDIWRAGRKQGEKSKETGRKQEKTGGIGGCDRGSNNISHTKSMVPATAANDLNTTSVKGALSLLAANQAL